MKKRVSVLFVCLSFLFVLFNSCSQQIYEEGKSTSISLCLPYANYERLAENEGTSLFYKVTCKSSTGQFNLEKTAFSGEKVFFQELYPGRYKISVNAYYSDKLLVELYAGEKAVNLRSGEQKTADITLSYTGPKTSIPINLWSLQNRNECARINLSGEKIWVSVTKDCPVKPVCYYWFCDSGIFENLSGPEYDVLEKIPDFVKDPESLGVIVKFDDDSYAVRSYLLDALIESSCLKNAEYTESTGSNNNFTYSFVYPDFNESSYCDIRIFSLDFFIENKYSSDGLDYKLKEPEKSVYSSSLGNRIPAKTTTGQGKFAEGWYLIETNLVMYSDGYGSTSNPMAYRFVNAVYIKDGYDLSYDVSFPFSEFYDNYFYELEWDLNGGEWTDSVEPVTYIQRDCAKIDGLFVIEINKPYREGWICTGINADKDVILVESIDDDSKFRIYIEPASNLNQKLKFTVEYKKIAYSVDELTEALADPQYDVIYLGDVSFEINETVNISRSVYILSAAGTCNILAGDSLTGPMFSITGNNEINVIIGDNENSLMFTGLSTREEYTPVFYVDGELSDVTFSNCEILSNYGSGIYCNGGNVVVAVCSFMECKADQGGALYCNDANLTVEYCYFIENAANDRGGAIYCNEECNVLIKNSSFGSNVSNVYGGAVHSEGSYMTIEDCEFVDNLSSEAGAIFATVVNTGTFTLKSSTFSKESADDEDITNLIVSINDNLDKVYIDPEILKAFDIEEVSGDIYF